MCIRDSYDNRQALADCYIGQTGASLEASNGGSRIKIMESLNMCRGLSDDLMIGLAKEKLVKGLKDPFSVQYEDVRRSGLKVTGRYNAKNSYGAYTGYKSFEVGLSPETGRWYSR